MHISLSMFEHWNVLLSGGSSVRAITLWLFDIQVLLHCIHRVCVRFFTLIHSIFSQVSVKFSGTESSKLVIYTVTYVHTCKYKKKCIDVQYHRWVCCAASHTVLAVLWYYYHFVVSWVPYVVVMSLLLCSVSVYSNLLVLH